MRVLMMLIMPVAMLMLELLMDVRTLMSLRQVQPIVTNPIRPNRRS